MSFAVGAMQSVAQYQAAAEESKATREAALQAFSNDQNALSRRQIQEADASNQKVQQVNLDEARKVSEVRLSASSAGVSGISVGNLIGDVTRQASTNRQNQFDNTKMAINQLQLEKKSSQAQAQSRINSAPKPSALGLIAGIGGATLSGFNTYNKQMSYADGSA
ncbi:MAG: hypothetical protein EOR11_19930 [Mesorhizobium sp.]|uniref:virion core protein, T7 gp14 family n=1 Tax=Mesorhizobium sp. TaxID=1871066 RepID=UPI000FEA3851|nr:hypothetical protein [Mesorhizobium sp.]RWP84732.1 MAG: hypothetical protein EOR11_19930 [Mesorhizobium sp.]